ncbi:oxidoreductase [Candidatus Woesearchaeota archaeon]|nr:oxidoreductase [Candidatus Woesearchaeota archaeon]
MLLTVTEVITETHDTKTLRFGFSKDKRIDFIPGQFIMLAIPTEKDGKKTIVNRSYSVASSPTKDYLDLTIKEVPDGFTSKQLQNTEVGEEFEFSGPYGNFVFNEKKMQKIVLIGSGSGISALHSIIQYIQDKELDTRATLIYSNKTPDDIIYKKELLEMNDDMPNFNLFLTITRPEEMENFRQWTGHTGRIDTAFLQQCVKDIKIPYFFLCGSSDFVKSMQTLLLELKVNKEKIKKEVYG